ncbi:MAG: enoyl-CoA hydratase/isomerase family protein [Dehalococcoidia bacterium]
MTKKYENIIVEKKGAIGYLTLNRPGKMNALSPELITEFEEACYDFRDDGDIKAFVIKGAGRCFSAGYDMSGETEQTSKESVEIWGRDPHPDGVWWRCLWDNPKISIAQVHSFCLAGGGHIISHCDIAYCDDKALFGYPPVRYAATAPQMLWPLYIGLRKAMEYFLTGNMMPAAEAYRLGFVNKVVPEGQLEREVERLTRTISKVTPWALKLNKRAVHEFYELMGLRTAIRYSEDLGAISLGSSPQAIPHGYQAVNEVTAAQGMRAGFQYMNEAFLEEDAIGRSQMVRPDRKP